VFDDITRMIALNAPPRGPRSPATRARDQEPADADQLSAERLAYKLADVSTTMGAKRSRRPRTIVNQVEAMKNLVNGFRDYARLPSR